MKLKKRLLSLFVTVCMLATMLPALSFAASTSGAINLQIGSKTMMVNGSSQSIDEQGTAATLLNPGYTMLPLRALVEAMGGTVTWNATAQSITIALNGHLVVVTIGSATALVDGTATTLQRAPYLTQEGRTMVHIRTLENFDGVKCTWNGTTNTVTVAYNLTAPVVTVPVAESRNITVYVCNISGESISKVSATPTGTANWVTMLSASIPNNSYKSGILRMGTETSWSFQLATSDGTWYLSNVDLSSYKNGSTVYLYVSDDNKYKFGTKTGEYKSDSSSSGDDGELTIRMYNETDDGLDFTKVYISVEDDDDWQTLFSSGIDYGDDASKTFDRDGDNDFDFRIKTEDGDYWYLYGVDMSDYDDDDTIKLYVYDDDDWDEGDHKSKDDDITLKLRIYNASDDEVDFEKVYIKASSASSWKTLLSSGVAYDDDYETASYTIDPDEDEYDLRILTEDDDYWYEEEIDLSDYDDGDTVKLYIYDDDYWRDRT